MKRLRFQEETKIITVLYKFIACPFLTYSTEKCLISLQMNRSMQRGKACKPEKLRHICSEVAHLSRLWAIRTIRTGVVSGTVQCSEGMSVTLKRRVCWWYWNPLPHPHPRVHSCQGARCHQTHWVGMNKKQRLLGEPELWHSAPVPGGKGMKG